MRQAALTLKRWRENPAAFALECCGFDPDKKQREYLETLPSQDADKKRISLQACTGSGKTAVGAIGLLNFISCYGTPTDHPRGLVTSITGANLHANIWPALSEWQQRSEFLKRFFTWTATRFSSNEFPATWFLEARSWSKRANAEEQGRTFSGLHAPFVKVFIDEAGDIPIPVLRSAEQIFSTQYRFAKLAIAGNPTSLNNALHHAATTARAMWHVIRMTADPDDPERSARADLENAREMIRLYSRENPWVMATILGMFPPASINALLGIEDVETAMKRNARPEDFGWAQKRLGIDVARFGDDRTVLAPRQGIAWGLPIVLRKLDTAQIAARAAVMIADQGTESIIIDDTGHWGHGVYDQLRAAGHNPIALNYSSDALKPQYRNRRTEMHMQLAEHVKAAAVLPNIPELVGELTALTYTYINGQFALVDKDFVKKVIGRSPDLADAYAQTYALPDMPAGTMAVNRAVMHAKTEFDPWREA